MCSENGQWRSRLRAIPASGVKGRPPALLCALLLALLAGSAWAHPELLQQIQRLDEAIAAQPGNAELLVQRGDLYRRHGDYTSATRDFKAARQIDPTFTEYDFYSGRLALEMGDRELALQQLGQYLQQNPANAAAWTLHGDTQLALGNALAAAADYGRAIATSTRPTPILYAQQAGALNAAGLDHQPAALAVIDQGLQLFPREVTLLGIGMDTALAMGEFEKARSYLEVLPPPIRALPQWQARASRLAEAGRPQD